MFAFHHCEAIEVQFLCFWNPGLSTQHRKRDSQEATVCAWSIPWRTGAWRKRALLCWWNRRALRSGSWQDTQGYLAKASCSCQKDLKMLPLPVVVWCSAPVCAVLASMLFKVPLRVPVLCRAQYNPRKSVGKELFSPFQNKKRNWQEAGTCRQSHCLSDHKK